MKGNVNPFEPWRPTEAQVPPPLRASQPWRPPPTRRAAAVEEPLLVEPVEPPRQRRAKQPPQPQRGAARKTVPPAPTTPLRTDQRIVLVLIFVLGIMGLVGLTWVGGTHFLRIAVTLLALATGFTTGISVAHRRNWYVRLGWMAGGLALAGLAAWFVPTLNGVNLWSAYRQVDEIRALPSGDVAGFRDGAPTRRLIGEEFPVFAADVQAAERDWLRRTVDEAIEKADRRLEHDPHRALRDLDKLSRELIGIETDAALQKDLEAAHQRAQHACLQKDAPERQAARR